MSGAFLIYHAVWRRAKRALAYTVLVSGWIAYEYLFLNGEISFPWLVLGNGFSMDVKLVQWYEYTGALGGSLWVLVVNLLVFEAWKRRREPSCGSLRRWRCCCRGRFADYVCHIRRAVRTDENNGRSAEYRPLP